MNSKDKVREFIRKRNLIRQGDRILLGLSGGADSVCLFYLLLEIRKEFGFALRAVHVHHGIREDADADAAYVKTLCEREGICCYFFREDIPAYAKEQGLGEEEAGRVLRYADFEKCLREWQEEEYLQDCPQKESRQVEFLRFKAATAHHQNDQAETVLFQLFRGCGLAGLRGILPERDRIIRPLLCLSREEIERFLRERGISWREDGTNQAEGYSRNKIRHRILPYAESEINSEVTAHIAKAAEIVREAERYIGRQTREAYGRVVKEQEGFVIFNISALHREDIFLQKELVLCGLERLQTAGKDIGAVHVEDVLKLSEKQGNGELSLPAGIKVQKSYQKLIISRGDSEEGEAREMPPMMLFEERGFLCGEKEPEIEWERIDLAEEEAVKKRFDVEHIPEIMKCIPQKTYTKWFDYDKIKMPFSVRHPESGDYLTIDGEMRHKSFRRYMIENKVPASCRNRIWLLADDSHVIWVPGGRMSEYYKVTAQTKTILQMKICREE